MRTALTALAVLAATAVTLLQAPTAYACFRDPLPFDQWLDEQAGADLVLVADVIRETSAAEVGPEYFRENPYGPDAYVIPPNRDTLRIAMLAPIVSLKGGPPPQIDLWPLGLGLSPDCAGGPDMPVGRRALIFVSWHDDRAKWIGEGSHFELGGPTAALHSVWWVDGMVVDTTELITEIARLTGADDATRDAALAAALQPPTLPSTGSADWAVPTGAPALVLIAGLAAAIAAGCAALGRAARRR